MCRNTRSRNDVNTCCVSSWSDQCASQRNQPREINLWSADLSRIPTRQRPSASSDRPAQCPGPGPSTRAGAGPGSKWSGSSRVSRRVRVVACRVQQAAITSYSDCEVLALNWVSASNQYAQSGVTAKQPPQKRPRKNSATRNRELEEDKLDQEPREL